VPLWRKDLWILHLLILQQLHQPQPSGNVAVPRYRSVQRSPLPESPGKNSGRREWGKSRHSDVTLGTSTNRSSNLAQAARSSSAIMGQKSGQWGPLVSHLTTRRFIVFLKSSIRISLISANAIYLKVKSLHLLNI
jgi:hypothetical protein